MEYNDQNRGAIQNRERARQIIDFSGVRFGNITPTDIDGMIEYHNVAFVFYELKLKGAKMPYGQELALSRMSKRLGDRAVVFLCEHDVDDASKDIPAAKTIVRRLCWCGEWHDCKPGITLLEYTQRFLNWIDTKIKPDGGA